MAANRVLDPDVSEPVGGRADFSYILKEHLPLDDSGELLPPTFTFLDAIEDIKRGITSNQVAGLLVRDVEQMVRSITTYLDYTLEFGTERGNRNSLEEGFDDRDLKRDHALAIALYSSAAVQGRGVYVALNAVMRKPNREGIEPFLRYGEAR